jgi:hypothetical protein
VWSTKKIAIWRVLLPKTHYFSHLTSCYPAPLPGGRATAGLPLVPPTPGPHRRGMGPTCVARHTSEGGGPRGTARPSQRRLPVEA